MARHRKLNRVHIRMKEIRHPHAHLIHHVSDSPILPILTIIHPTKSRIYPLIK
ncbi:hypothetical protein Hanom_Chr09g00772061 [Helianthus anomalus]